MAQIQYFYNNTSLAEAVTDAQSIVGTTKNYSNIVEFNSKYGSLVDQTNTYDNIVEFTGNPNKITWETVNGKQVATTNKVTTNPDGSITTQVTGVLVLLNIYDACRNALLGMGMKELVKSQDQFTWGKLYPFFQQLCADKQVSEDRMKYAKIACTMDANGNFNTPENFLSDVATALQRAQFAKNEYSKVFNLGETYTRSQIGLSTDYTPAFHKFLTYYTALTLEEKAPYGNIVDNSAPSRALAGLIKYVSDNHLDYNSVTYHLYTVNGYTYREFRCVATAVLLASEITILGKDVIGINNIHYTIGGNQAIAVASYEYVVRRDLVYDEKTSTGSIIPTSSNHILELGYLGGTTHGTGQGTAHVYGSSSSIGIGDPPEGIEYIGDPLTLAPWEEQYPAWKQNLKNGLIPVGSQPATGDDPQKDIQDGKIPDSLPYPWEGIRPDPIKPIDDSEPPIDPEDDAPEEPKPHFPYIPIDPPSYNANKLYTVHTIDDSNMNTLGGYLWSSNFISLIEHMFSEPVDAVLGMHELHYGGSLPLGGSEVIKLGAFSSGATGNRVTNRYMEFSCGSVSVKEFYGNVEDYAPHTKIQLYLPYIGYVDLNANEVMGKTMRVSYGIDIYTGGCVARVFVNSKGVTQELYNFYGQCGCQLPVTGQNYTSIVTKPLLGAGLGAVAGGIGGAVTGALSGAMSSRVTYSRSNGFNNNVGAMTLQKPVLIVERPKVFNASSYPAFYGNPTNWTVTLSQCVGYTRVKDIHLDTVTATDYEKQEIERLLKEGVIF